MNLRTIHEHTIDVDLLTGGVCIDAGCRGFLFSEAMRDLGEEVIAFDIQDMEPPEGIKFYQCAISTKKTLVQITESKDPQGVNIVGKGGGDWIASIDINDVYEQQKDKVIDVLKMDIEGMELLVLSDPNFQPIPRQLSIEWHIHCHRKLHDKYYNACMNNLLKNYEPVQHFMSQEHGAGYNFWDSCFIRRDLL